MAVNVKSIESKSVQKPAGTAVSTTQTKKAESFFVDVKTEFGKITWTNKDELRAYTKIVVGATFICGLGVYFVDLGIRIALSTLQAITHFIFG